MAVLKELAVNDLIAPEEWAGVRVVFNRVEWLRPYPGLTFKTTPRPAYAYYRVSPDYTVLELLAWRGGRSEPRPIRVSLVDGTLLPADAKLEGDRLPVRPFKGPDTLTDNEPRTREGYVPSLDPVRTEGELGWKAPPMPVLALVKDDFKKLDTPAWLPGEKALYFTDLDAGKLYKFDPATKAVTEARAGGRARVGTEGRLVGLFGGKLCAWEPGEEPKAILDKTDVSLNDLAVSPAGRVYFTTLKDPEKGRLTVIDPKAGTAKVAFDGDPANPNGVTVSPDDKHLFVAVSSYKDRRKAGLFRFALNADGSLDLASGKKRWATAAAPDGLAFGPGGLLYCTDGPIIRAFTPDGVEVGRVKVPKGSATNLTFGGRTLFVTTSEALYAGVLTSWKVAQP